MDEGNHFASAFKNNCVTRPRHPDSNLPLTKDEALFLQTASQGPGLIEKEKRLLHEEELDEELERNRTDIIREDHNDTVRVDSDQSHSKRFDNELSNLLQDDAKFYKHLQALRLENKKTLRMLERFYHTKSHVHQDDQPRDLVSRMRNEAEVERDDLFARKVYNAVTNSNTEDADEQYDEYRQRNNGHLKFDNHSADFSSTESEEDPRKDWPRKYSENILPDDKDDDFRGRQFSYQVIDNMWDNFSVDSYAPIEKGLKAESQQQKEWKPSITIPQPFNMTLREAAKAKTKSKKMERLEKELLEKKMAEEAELNKKFRARPLPAATFTRRYEEQQAEEEQKREYRKSLNKAILEATQRPFNFVKREEEKKEVRRVRSIERLDKTSSTTTGFRAAPFPEKLFNLSLEDKIAEQNEYRKIKMKMRAEEMLAKSTLPPNMQSRGEKYASNKRYAKRGEKVNPKKTKNRSFRPNINHDIPDYEELHRKFEIDLIRKRREKSPTICEPFNLHTAKVPSRRSRALVNSTPDLPERDAERFLERSKQTGLSGSSRSLLSRSIPDEPPPFAMTETARLRRSLKEATLAKQAKAEEEERRKADRRRRREDQLRQEVSRKSIANDMKHVLQKQNKETLKRFRESEMERKRAYKEYLREIMNKVDKRPLLFEQESQTNAKRIARRKYRQILQEAGVEEDLLESLVTEDGKIVDAESDDDTDELLLGVEDEADQSGLNDEEQKLYDTVVLDDSDGVESASKEEEIEVE